MDKTDWMPDNPFPLVDGSDDFTLQYNRNKGWRLGVVAGQKKLLEYLIGGHRCSPYEDSPTSQKVSIYQLRSMLKQLEEENG